MCKVQYSVLSLASLLQEAANTGANCVAEIIGWKRKRETLRTTLDIHTNESAKSVASPAEGCSIQASTAHRSAPDTRRPPTKDMCPDSTQNSIQHLTADVSRVVLGFFFFFKLYLSWHVHQEHSSNRPLCLAVTLIWFVLCVGLQHFKQTTLPACTYAYASTSLP